MCLKYCDSLKEHSEAPLLGHHLCHQNQAYPDEIRHFGLSLIENAIRFKWNDGSYSDKDRGQIRDLVLDLVKNVNTCMSSDVRSPRGSKLPHPLIRPTYIFPIEKGVRPHDLEKSFIKEKLVRSFVEIVKRMWPLSWVELNTTLRTMYTQNVRIHLEYMRQLFSY